MLLADLLQTVPMFSDFTQGEIMILEKVLRVQSYRDGHTFIKEGTGNQTMYLIIDGEVQVTRTRANAPGYDLVKKLGQGDIFGLISLIDRGISTATCRASGKVEAASLPRPAFDLLMNNHASIAKHFKRLVARQLAHDIKVPIDEIADLIEAGNTEEIRRFAEADRD